MKAEIITIGDEILIGQTIDTNSAWMATQLNLIGIEILKITSISDEKKEIFKAVDHAKENSDLVLITGGLGPTNDDITKESIAEYFGAKLVQNKEVLTHIEEFVIKRRSAMNQRNIRQSFVPDNCEIVHNKIGTAPGMLFRSDGKIILSMPGVPQEMKEMMTNHVIPYLSKLDIGNEIIHKNILVQGKSESALAEILEEWESQSPDNISLAYLPSPGTIKLRLTAKGGNKKELLHLIDIQIKKIKKIIPEFVCGYNSETLEQIVGRLLKEKNKTLCVAESCTGGSIAQMITSVPGSSAYFYGGLVAYANNIKEHILGVNINNINNYGAVSKQVVEDMALGVKDLFKTDFSIATSGIAGPDGGTKSKPVGTTWIAVASKSKVVSKKFIFGDLRERNIKRASVTALNMLQKLISDKEI